MASTCCRMSSAKIVVNEVANFLYSSTTESRSEKTSRLLACIMKLAFHQSPPASCGQLALEPHLTGSRAAVQHPGGQSVQLGRSRHSRPLVSLTEHSLPRDSLLARDRHYTRRIWALLNRTARGSSTWKTLPVSGARPTKSNAG